MSTTTPTLGQVGIDKSNLSTRDFRLTDSLRLTHKPPMRIALDPTSLVNSQDVGSIPWGMDGNGRELTGSYFLNLPSGVGVDLSSRGLLINLNPSRVIRRNDPTFLVTTPQDLISTREIVQRELDQLGLEVDVLSMNVCRLDPSKQVNTIDTANRYQGVGQMISASRVKGRQYDTAFMLGNTQRQFIFYSKHDHLLFHKHDSSNPHLGRGELKLLNSKVVNSTLGVTNYKSLIDLDPDQLTCQFHNVVNSFVFSNKVDPSTLDQINYQNEVTLYETFFKCQRNGADKYLALMGIRFVLDNFGSVANFGKMLQQINVPRSTRYRVITKMKDQVQKVSFIENKRNTQTILDKYTELQRNFGISI
jgi:hypothetical protein